MMEEAKKADEDRLRIRLEMKRNYMY